MSIVLMPISESEYVPNYLFLYGDDQAGPCKNRHVMKEFLRKRNTIRRQEQLASRPQGRVLPWLRRENMERQSERVDACADDAGASPESSYAASTAATSPQTSQWTNPSTAIDGHSSPEFSSSGSVRLSNAESSVGVCHKHHDLLNYLFRMVLGQMSGTSQTNDNLSSATTMARHVLERRLPGQVLLAVSSLCQDMDSGHQHPSSTTITLMLESIHRLKEQLEKPDGVGDDTILAMTNLWVYEAVLAMGRVDVPGQKPRHNPGASQQSIQTHVDGLQRSIKHVGGLSRLSPEAMWSVAWCVGNLPGYSPIDTPVVNGSTPSMEPGSIGSYCSVTRLLDFLAKIQRLASSPYFQPSMLHEKSFVMMKQTVLRLVEMDTDPKTPLRRLMRSTALVSILLLIFDILLGGSDKGVQGPKERRVQMMEVQDRLREHNIDQEGSPQKAWQVLMTQAETPNLQLHPRAWSVVEMVNVIKHLSMSTMGSLSQLLLKWLLPETSERAEGFRYERILLKIHYELDGLGSLP